MVQCGKPAILLGCSMARFEQRLLPLYQSHTLLSGAQIADIMAATIAEELPRPLRFDYFGRFEDLMYEILSMCLPSSADRKL